MIIALLLAVIFNVYLANKKERLETELRHQKAELTHQEQRADFLSAMLDQRDRQLVAFQTLQAALNMQLIEQQQKQQATEAKLNEVLHDESVKEWGDDVVPVAISRLFEQQKSRDSAAAASAVSDRTDVSANHADDQKK